MLIPLKLLMISFFGAAFVLKLLDSTLEFDVFPFEAVAAGVTNPSLPFAVLAMSEGCDMLLANSTGTDCFDLFVKGDSGLAGTVS